MHASPNRREFLRRVAVASVGATFAGRAKGGPNDRLNIGVVGTAGRAADNIAAVEGENIVAFCDIDDRLLAAAAARFPRAKAFADFREMIAMPGLDAVVVSTADHSHAPATALALKAGKHVYCEKPLTHTVHEARVIAGLAAKAKVATQMGTQIHADDNYRRVVELIKAGAIGPVREVHVFCGKSWSGGDRPSDTPPVPPGLHWDLWIGAAPMRPYNPIYQPANWRGWWDFGNGTLGDMACHHMDLPFWALDLRHPSTVEADGPPVHPETTPAWMKVLYEFPERGDKPPVTLTWYDGDEPPAILARNGIKGWSAGNLFVGDKGMLLADYDRRVLLPERDFADFHAPEPSIPASIGHHAEWIAACKDGRPTTCNFDYAGALTEAVLLGNVAYRVGKKLAWDAPKLEATHCPEADRFLRKDYRPGWSL